MDRRHAAALPAGRFEHHRRQDALGRGAAPRVRRRDTRQGGAPGGGRRDGLPPREEVRDGAPPDGRALHLLRVPAADRHRPVAGRRFPPPHREHSRHDPHRTAERHVGALAHRRVARARARRHLGAPRDEGRRAVRRADQADVRHRVRRQPRREGGRPRRPYRDVHRALGEPHAGHRRAAGAQPRPLRQRDEGDAAAQARPGRRDAHDPHRARAPARAHVPVRPLRARRAAPRRGVGARRDRENARRPGRRRGSRGQGHRLRAHARLQLPGGT
mmetsp:Transcript_12641/g.39329  ORF Transcript_12641/g.39329 Transcript_12641/m.39329 type:complete len:273 (+) Transcript_12641:394-1212(+)